MLLRRETSFTGIYGTWEMKEKKTLLDNAFLLALRCLTPLYYVGFLFKRWVSWKKNSKQFPVISVGNLTLGGTGKTPCVEYISRKLLERERKVAVLATGFGRDVRQKREIVFSKGSKNFSLKEVGDESYLLAKHLRQVPVFVSRNRAGTLLYASEKSGCNTFVMDDGFQYFRVGKELDILLISKDNPFGNGHLFPGGTLREPISSVRRADLVVITHADSFSSQGVLKDKGEISRENLSKVLSQRRAGVPILESIHYPLYFEDWGSGEKYQLEELKGKRAVSLSSLADPLYFESSLERLGLSVIRKIRFPDHYPYRLEDMEWILNTAGKDKVDFIISTEKDAVRFPQKFSPFIPILLLVIDFRIIKGEDIFDNLLDRVLEKY